MSKKRINTPSGDRKRDRAIRRARVAQPLQGNRIRVRAKRLDQVDVEKLTLAYWGAPAFDVGRLVAGLRA